MLASDNWETWLDEHGAGLLLFARQYLASLADAEDALQDAFVRFWRSRPVAQDRLAYLYRCVRNAALDRLRAGRRRQQRERVAAEVAPDAWFDTRSEDVERREAIERALDQLPMEQREPLVMRMWGGATFQQIAAALEVTPKTASARYNLALESLSLVRSEDFVG